MKAENKTKTDEPQSRSTAGLGLPSDAEYLANAMQFGSDMVTKYSRVCVAYKQECDDADELMRLLRLDPEIYRTEAGIINMPKVKAALKNPEMYPMMPNLNSTTPPVA